MRMLVSLTFFQLSILSFGQTPAKPVTFDFDSLIKAKANQIGKPFPQTPAKTVTIDWDSLMKAKANQILGKPFPHFVAANEKGKISNDSLIGKVVLINFWFEGCQPCIAEFDALNELAQKLTENKNF